MGFPVVVLVLEVGPTGRDVGGSPEPTPDRGAATRATRWRGSSSRELSQHTRPHGGPVEGVTAVVEGAVEALGYSSSSPEHMQPRQGPGRWPVAATWLLEMQPAQLQRTKVMHSQFC